MKTIILSSLKGGVAKTTTSQAVIENLREKKYKVLAIDLDQQGNLSDSLNILSNKYSIYDVLAKKVNIKKAIENDGLKSSEQIILLPQNIGINALKEHIKKISDNYDFCIIDTAPKNDKTLIMGLVASDYVIIPTLPDSFSYKGINKTTKLINEVQKQNQNKPEILGILLSMFNDKYVLHKQIKDVIMENLKKKNIHLFNNNINKNVAIAEAQISHTTFNNYSNKCKAVVNYRYLVDEILNLINDDKNNLKNVM